MKRAIFILLASVGAGGAFAHPATVPHDHPHGPSVWPGVDLLVIAVVVAALATIVAGKFLKRW